MKKNQIYLIVGVLIVLGIIGIISFTSSIQEESYVLSINGIKENYQINEELQFFISISGSGYQCGQVEISLQKPSEEISPWKIHLDCASDPTFSEFNFKLPADNSTLNYVLDESGIHTINAKFLNSAGKGKTIISNTIFNVMGNE